VHQDGERLTIAPTGLLDEVSIHHRPPMGRADVVRFSHYDGRVDGERSAGGRTNLCRMT
jgi:hypothetical protein